MSEFIGWVSDVFAMELATVGGSEITLGLVLAASVLIQLGVGTFRRIRGRG